MIKTLYICWFQGFSFAPEIVQKCLQSWKHYNPDWNIIELEQSNLARYMDVSTVYGKDFPKQFTKTQVSEFLRIYILYTYGGLWVDATTFCNRPLREWLPEYIGEGFFGFDKPGTDRLLSSWFLYSEPANLLAKKWLHSVQNYYATHARYHTYFWFHGTVFSELYTKDVEFRNQWDRVPKVSAKGPHTVQILGMFHTMSSETKHEIDTKCMPLYKLTYKCTFPEDKDVKRALYYLYSTIDIRRSLPTSGLLTDTKTSV